MRLLEIRSYLKLDLERKMHFQDYCQIVVLYVYISFMITLTKNGGL